MKAGEDPVQERQPDVLWLGIEQVGHIGPL